MKSFIGNEYPTLGVEEEFHLIDPYSADLIPKADMVVANIDNKEKERVCYELFSSVIESRTKVCRTSNAIVEDIIHGRKVISKSCEKCSAISQSFQSIHT